MIPGLDQRPVVVALAGPNGAGKSTFYGSHLKATGLRLVNADVLARELEIDAYRAAEIAKAFGIRIYTIGVGTRGEAPYPVQTPFGTRYQMVPVEIDEEMLQKISGLTDGQYFRATNNRALAEIYEKIDKLEKTKIEITSYKNASEKYHSWLWSGLILLLFELGLSRTILRKLP